MFSDLIRAVPDFPKPGILFRDITPALEDPKAFKEIIDGFVQRYAGKGITKVAGIESRGFIIASALAYQLGAGMVILRKPGKLPRATMSANYALEYGEATLHLHNDSVHGKDKVLVVDDLVATGGTLGAAIDLVTRAGGEVVESACIIELDFLGGRAKLPKGTQLFSLLHY